MSSVSKTQILMMGESRSFGKQLAESLSLDDMIG